METASQFYLERGIVANQRQMTIDVFVPASIHPTEAATLYNACRMSCGRLRTYATAKHLEADVPVYLSMKRAYEAMLRIRCSRGVKVQTMYGSCYVKTPELVTLPTCDEASTFAIYLKPDGPLTSEHIFIQATLMYTNMSGQRKLRVHNIALQVVSNLVPVYGSVDIASMVIAMARPITDDLVHDPTTDIYGSLTKSLESTLQTFRQSCLSVGQRHAATSALVLPVKMQGLPLLVYGLLRSAVCLPLDRFRMALISHISLSPVAMTSMMLAPITFGLYHPKVNTQFRLVPTSSAYLMDEPNISTQCVSLIDSGGMLTLCIGKDCPRQYLLSALGTDNFDTIRSMKDIPAIEGSEINEQLRGATRYRIRGLLVTPFHVVIVPPSGQDVEMSALLGSLLVEDVQRSSAGKSVVVTQNLHFTTTLSYVTYLTHLKTHQLQKS
jgi:protein transport protein SEC24